MKKVLEIKSKIEKINNYDDLVVDLMVFVNDSLKDTLETISEKIFSSPDITNKRITLIANVIKSEVKNRIDLWSTEVLNNNK